MESFRFCNQKIAGRGLCMCDLCTLDGNMLRVHRVIVQASLDKSVCEWLEPTLRHKHKHKEADPLVQEATSWSSDGSH